MVIKQFSFEINDFTGTKYAYDVNKQHIKEYKLYSNYNNAITKVQTNENSSNIQGNIFDISNNIFKPNNGYLYANANIIQGSISNNNIFIKFTYPIPTDFIFEIKYGSSLDNLNNTYQITIPKYSSSFNFTNEYGNILNGNYFRIRKVKPTYIYDDIRLHYDAIFKYTDDGTITHFKQTYSPGYEIEQSKDLYKEVINRIIYRERNNTLCGATLKCIISKYEQHENLNEEKYTPFEIGDLLCVKVEEDKPLARYKDGSPMVFRVCQTNLEFNGVGIQNLTLIEYPQNMLGYNIFRTYFEE